MELRHLRYFVTAASERNISRAAALLNISQPAVSRQIRALEDELGVTLFVRASDGLHLTDAGQTALAHAQDLLRSAADLQLAMDVFRAPSKRPLRVGFIATALAGFLASSLRAFNRKHSDVCTHIREMSPLEQEEALRVGDIDIALLGTPRTELKKEFRTEVILKTPMAIVLPDDHSLATRKSLDLAELASDPFVTLHERHFPGRPALLADLCGRAGFIADVRSKADGIQALLGMVGGGAVVGVLPADVSQLPHPGVVFVKMHKPRLSLTSSAVWRKDRESAELLELIALLKSSKST